MKLVYAGGAAETVPRSELELDLLYVFFHHLSRADVAFELLTLGSAHAVQGGLTDDMAACEKLRWI